MNPLLSRVRAAGKILLRGEETSTRQAEIPALSKEDILELREFFPMEKFFIFGHARSGTTLLARLIRLHPEVHCNWQAHFFTRKPLLKAMVASREMEEWLTRRSNRWNHGKDLSPLVLRAAADFILERDARREGKSIVGDKSPNTLLNGEAVRNMHLVYPDAYLLYIVRDGRDVLISERFRNFVEESRYLTEEDKKIIAELRENPRPFSTGERSIFTEKWLRRAAKGWVKNLEETEREGKRLYGERYYSLRYEDLLASPFLEMQKIWAFLGAREDAALKESIKKEMNSNPDQTWQQERNESIASFLPKGKAGNWRNLFTRRDKEIFDEIAGEMLEQWQYPRSLE